MSGGNLKPSKQSPVNYNLSKQQYISMSQSQDTEAVHEKGYLCHWRHRRRISWFYKKIPY